MDSLFFSDIVFIAFHVPDKKKGLVFYCFIKSVLL